MTISIKLIEYIQTVINTNDIIHLHNLVNGIYDEIKSNAFNVDWESINTFVQTHPTNTTLSDELVHYIQTRSINDILQLHILVCSIYDKIKATTKNFAAQKWACLHPNQNRANNKIQQQKSRQRKQQNIPQEEQRV